jgi:alpha/beta superfamily hydrolase
MLREIQGPAGRLEALLEEPTDAPAVNAQGLLEATPPDGPRAAVVFAHPHPQHGGTMHTKGVYQSAKALGRIGCAVLRFNFRGVGRSEGVWDEGVGEREDFRAALDVMAQRYPGVPLWSGGMSFGSWIGMTVGAEDPRVSTLIGVAMPVDRYDYAIVRDSRKAKFIVHGEFDELCSIHDVRAFYAQAADPKELAVIDAANHLFEGKVSQVGDALEDLLSDWPEE